MNHRRTFVSVLAVFFLAVFFTSALAQGGDGDEGNLGARVALGAESIGSGFPTAATLAFGPSMYYKEVTISNVSVNGGNITAPITPGETVDIELDYSIASNDCPGCIQQIVFGFASDSKPGFCIHTGVGDDSGSSSFTLTAPATPGTHYLAFGRRWEFNCTDALLKTWPAIGLKSYFGAVAAQGDYILYLPAIIKPN